MAGASLLLAGLSLSPDGQRVALSLGLAPGQVLVHDLARGTLTRVSSRTFPRAPVWMPSGDRLLYTSSQGARAWNVRVRRADAGGEERILAADDETQVALAVSPDGATLLYWQGGNAGGSLLALPTDGSRPAQPIVGKEAGRLGASFSPDGRFIAYDSRESGRTEVYVRSSSTSDERVQVSTNGGESPVWKRDDEILFLSGDVVNAVSVARRGSSIVVSKPVELFRTGGASRLAPAFDVTPDGQHFYLLRSRGHSRLSVVLGWPRDLARLQAEALQGTTR